MILLSRLSMLALMLMSLASATLAHGYKVGAIEIGHPWTRETPGGAKIAGGYLTLTNTGSEPDRLISVSLENAGRVEIHQMAMDNGVMQMRPITDGIAVKPGETVKLAPGGFHVMFMDLKEPVKKGDRLKGELRFEKAGAVPVEFVATGIGGTPGEEHKH